MKIVGRLTLAFEKSSKAVRGEGVEVSEGVLDNAAIFIAL